MTSYLSREVELSKRHEDIIAKRAELLQEMKIQHERQESQKTDNSQQTEAAHKRNQSILEDLQIAEQNLMQRVKSSPTPATITLESDYWDSIEKEIPKWEQFFLGKTQSPYHIKQTHLTKKKGIISQTMKTSRKDKLPPSGFHSNTFPR
ncbi:uncharacterized protein C3orf14 homolog [Bombina bombina]|uniref:uncharacterized protein C3orf14 homolog n=1 Tax=Bombina bombina TaxID=8345 RepID=UPI00235A5A14|nr:uncharacterized protein C3orf14 homolog [Bombina bombina]